MRKFLAAVIICSLFVCVVFSIGFVRDSLFTIYMSKVDTVVQNEPDGQGFLIASNYIYNGSIPDLLIYGYRSSCDCAVVQQEFPIRIKSGERAKVLCKLASKSFDNEEAVERRIEFYHDHPDCGLIWRLRVVK